MSEFDEIKAVGEGQVDRAIALLMEHFDAVQVLCCRLHGDGSTGRIYKGRGLWHARTGMATEFLEEDQADTTARGIAGQLDIPDEGEGWKEG